MNIYKQIYSMIIIFQFWHNKVQIITILIAILDKFVEYIYIYIQNILLKNKNQIFKALSSVIVKIRCSHLIECSSS